MKKILIILMVLASIFLLSDKVYAEGKTSIHDLSVTIELNDDDDSISVKEAFEIKNVTPDTYFSKLINNSNNVYKLDSNYYPSYYNGIPDASDSTIFHASSEEADKDYSLSYIVKNRTIRKGEKYTFEYTPPVLESDEPLYENIHIVIRATADNPVTLDTLRIDGAGDSLKAEADGNVITITGDGYINKKFVISFDKVSHLNGTSEIADMASNIMMIVLIAMVTLTVMKVITGNQIISNYILIVAIGGALLFLGTTGYMLITNSEIGIGITGLFPLAFCMIFYGIFYGALFFSKKVIKQNKMAIPSAISDAINLFVFTFAKLFVCVHSYFMISAFTGSSMLSTDLADNKLLVLLIAALFIGSYGYQYFDRDKTAKNFNNIEF